MYVNMYIFSRFSSKKNKKFWNYNIFVFIYGGAGGI